MQGEWPDWREWARVSIRGRQMCVRRMASEMMGARSLRGSSTVRPRQTEQADRTKRGERLTGACRSAIVWMPGYKALIVHVHAWECAGDGLHLRPSSMSVRACVRESMYLCR